MKPPKLTPREVYEYWKGKGVETAIAIHFMNEAQYGKTFYKCIRKANDNPSLLVPDCTPILNSVYGYKAVKNMSRAKLFYKINEMMRVNIDFEDTENINEEIEFIKS